MKQLFLFKPKPILRWGKILLLIALTLSALFSLLSYSIALYENLRPKSQGELMYDDLEGALSYAAEQVSCINLAKSEGNPSRNQRDILVRAQEICEQLERESNFYALIGILIGLAVSLPLSIWGAYRSLKEIRTAYEVALGKPIK